MEYVFILGRSSKLCLAELEATFKREGINYQLLYSSAEVFHLRTDRQLDTSYLIGVLGGTVKISLVFDFLEKHLNLPRLLKKIITGVDKEKKAFGLSFYGRTFSFSQLEKTVREIKKMFKEDKRSYNYVLPTEGLTLSSVVVTKRNLSEIIIIEEDDRYVLAKTLCVQDFTNWNKRDYERPFVNPKKGMLPPKVARMMVNLGISSLKLKVPSFKILDPFCGMGTILAEAMMVGCNVIGSDLDRTAIEKVKRNLEWLKKEFQLQTSKFQLLVYDATHISEKLEKESINAVITEPYLGPLIETKDLGLRNKDNKKITKEYLKNIITGLEKLYIGCLRNWWKILTPGGLIVIVLPSFNIAENRRFSVEKPIDNCEKLGYNLVAGPYQYFRPKAVVIRNIYILKKSKIKNQNARPP